MKINKFIKIIFSIIIGILMLSCSSQNIMKKLAKTPDINCYKILENRNYSKYQKDFIYFTEVLKETHPDVHRNFPAEEFERQKANVLKSLANIDNENDFRLILQKFTAKLKDSHTYIITPDIFKFTKKCPLKYMWLKDELYISNVSIEMDTNLIGATVLSIDNKPLKQLEKTLGNYISADNKIWRRKIISHLFTSPECLQRLNIINSNDSLILGLDSKTYNDSSIVIYAENNPKFSELIKNHPTTGRNKDLFSYKIIPEYKLVYFQFNSFSDKVTVKQKIKCLNFIPRIFAKIILLFRGTDNFSDFLEGMFADIYKNDVENLIIDLRYNGGGVSILGDQLLYYLDIPENIKSITGAIKISNLLKTEFPGYFEEYNQIHKKLYNEDLPLKLFKFCELDTSDADSNNYFSHIEDQDSPFYIKKLNKRFKGKIFLLIGPRTFSSASLFAGILSDNKLVTTIGQPTGQSPSHFGDMLLLKLPNTDTYCFISHKIFIRPDESKSSDLSLFPDVEIWPTIVEYKQGKDPVFEYVLKQIEKEK